MAAPLSRRALAQHTAKQLLAGDKQALPRLAAYIVDAGRRKEATLIARDIERALLGHGVCVATVTTARPLSAARRKEITQLLKHRYAAQQVELQEQVDPTLLGGTVIKTPRDELDASLRARLSQLKSMNIKEEHE